MTLSFKLERDPDAAAADVRDRGARTVASSHRRPTSR